jgi:hypothetical protein
MNGTCLNQISDEEFEEYWFSRLPENRAKLVEVHCAECTACRWRWERARAEIGWLRLVLTVWDLRNGERRSQPRHPADDWLTIEFLNASSGLHRVHIRLVDESRGGLGAWCGECVQPGQWVALERHGQPLRGIVRYCHPAGYRFRIGIQLAA